MASVIPMATTPVRQPFGLLDASRLTKLSSLKNRQNGISSTPSSLKRRCPSPSLSDSENIDPSLQKSAGKRKRLVDDTEEDCQPTKVPINSITLVSKPRQSLSSLPSIRTETPKLSVRPMTTTTPASAPVVAAGRSPKSSNRVGILSRSRRGLSRNDSAGKSRNSAQLSFAAALKGTLAYSKPSSKATNSVPTIEESKPKSWIFDIHEDTPEEEMVNLMGHSTCVLDISDDESRTKDQDDRGKENVPPVDMGPIATVAPASRRDAMTDEPRTPLGDLKPEDFYAEGCDASSVIVVPGDDVPVEKVVTSSIDNILAGTSSNVSFNFTNDNSSLMKKSELNALIFGSEVAKSDPVEAIEEDNEDAATDIEIWESASAKDESVAGDVEESIFAV